MSGVRRFIDLMDQEWEERVANDPLLATRSGETRYNGELPKINLKYYQNLLSRTLFYLNETTKIDTGEFNSDQKLNYEIFIWVLQNQVLRLENKFYMLSMSKVNGFHLTLTSIFRSSPFNTLKDYENYISRLEKIPEYVSGHIEIMRKAIEIGIIQPRTTMNGVSRSMRDQIKDDPTISPYYTPFQNFPESIVKEDREILEKKGKDLLISNLFASFEVFADFLDKEYMPYTRDDLAAINLPNGKKFYESCIKYHTTLSLTPKEIHDLGINEVSRIRAEMKSVIDKANFKGDIPDFIDFLRTSPEFYVEKPEELLEKVARICKKIDGALPMLFKTLPRLPYGIEPIPDYSAPGNYTAYYSYGTGDGTRSGTYFVNTYDLKSRGLFEYDALSLHEAVPGHHLQLALQQENEVPNFRKYENFNAFIEGWALYAERLGFDCGLYQTPYTNFGRLSFEMWRACRLVVDTGIHAFGWSRQQAIDYMKENTALSLLNIENEVDRYISWPGQALAYKLGEIKIRELRSSAEDILGPKFDIREFHDAILQNGSQPLEVLETDINNWMKHFSK